jgi:hypothetical protein
MLVQAGLRNKCWSKKQMLFQAGPRNVGSSWSKKQMLVQQTNVGLSWSKLGSSWSKKQMLVRGTLVQAWFKLVQETLVQEMLIQAGLRNKCWSNKQISV